MPQPDWRMYCVARLEPPLKVSLRVLKNYPANRKGLYPHLYMARNNWVWVENSNALTQAEWKFFVWQSYKLVVVKLAPEKLKSRSASQKSVGITGFEPVTPTLSR